MKDPDFWEKITQKCLEENTEIIQKIIDGNPASKTSDLRKVQILQIAARCGNATDIQKVYDVYKSFEFESGALSYACEYADKEKIAVLLKNGAKFRRKYLPRNLLAKYEDDPWNYFLSILPDEFCRRKADNPALALTFAGRKLHWYDHTDGSMQDRADIIISLYDASIESDKDSIYSVLMIKALRWGYYDLVVDCLNRGISLNSAAIETVNDMGLIYLLGRLLPEQRYHVLKLLCDTADACSIKITPYVQKDIMKEILMQPELSALIFEHCDLQHFAERENIKTAVLCESAEYLSLMESKGYFDNTQVRNAALEYAQENNCKNSVFWLLDATNRIRLKKNMEGKRTKYDSAHAKWFKHKGDTITGISKAGLREINNNKITEVSFPSIIDGVPIIAIDCDFTYEFSKLVPDVNTVFVPKGIYIDGRLGLAHDCKKIKQLENKGVKKIIFESDESFYSSIIGDSVENIIIKNGEHYRTVDGIVFSKDMKTLYFFPRGKRVPSYVLPETVTQIAADAFRNCTIDELIIPETIELRRL